jgi:cyclopropane fatty-acyl-phospholipid synthase-like methyltransferase
VFLSPPAQERARRLVHFLATDLTGTVLDLGCGWAEVLLQVLTGAPTAHGVGVDVDAVSLAHGRELAEQRGLGDRVTLLEEDPRTAAPRHADAVICLGASQIWGPPLEDELPLDYVSALVALRATVQRGAGCSTARGSGRVRRRRRRWPR